MGSNNKTATMIPDQKAPLKAVSCYRSAGSLPIPEQTRPVVKKRIKLSKYKEDTEEIEFEDPCPFTAPTLPEDDTAIITLVCEVCENSPVIIITTTHNCPPPKPKQKCTKHTRCHCDLLGSETTDFFLVTQG